ncbi:hypothetical protein BN2364_0745 [Alloalcanivorax xenomutans]|nr:hypothetical protein [Alloalcanivorax xenomutans]CUR45186.1 hypothetical protein BN2364_0745 [Alloalcanivorax xenomutans]
MVSAKAVLILHGKQATNDEVRQAVMAAVSKGTNSMFGSPGKAETPKGM